MTTPTIIDATLDPHLFAPWFRDRATWSAWFAFLAALFGLPMTEEQLAIFQQCTGRAESPTRPATEAWLVCGRRSGKSFTLALCAVFLACFKDHRRFLAPGERATIMVIATDRRQARIILRYISALLLEVPVLRQMVERTTAESFDLDNGASVEVHVASFRSTRGYAIIAALLDELAFWPTDDAAEPDREVINALKPGMATIPDAMLLCASSPYAKRGALFDAHRKHFGKDNNDILVWQAATRVMNPKVPQSVIDAAMERDPADASAEYLAQFRSDIEGFVDRAVIEACITPHVYERPPQSGLHYVAFVDPSGGSADSFTAAIAHKDIQRDAAVVDALREIRPPFSPEQTVAEMAQLLKSYRISRIEGDRYAGEWPREQFSKHGIHYEPSAKPKSGLYVDLLPLLNSARIELLDHPRLIGQLCSLERRTARGGKDSIDHAPGGHDDLANAVAGVAVAAINKYGGYDVSYRWVNGDDADDPDGARAWRAARLAAYLSSGGMVRL